MTTQKILADPPSRVEIMTGLATDQVDQLVLLVYAATGFVPGLVDCVYTGPRGRARRHVPTTVGSA